MQIFTILSITALAAAIPRPYNILAEKEALEGLFKNHHSRTDVSDPDAVSTADQPAVAGRGLVGADTSGVRFDGYNSKTCGGDVLMGYSDTGGSGGMQYGVGYQAKSGKDRIFAYEVSKDLQQGQRLEFYSTKNGDKCGNLMQKHTVKDEIKANTCYRISNGAVPMTCVKMVKE